MTPTHPDMVSQGVAQHDPASAPPASSATLPELIRAVDRLSTGLETGRIYDRDFVALGPALERLGAAWVRRTSR